MNIKKIKRKIKDFLKYAFLNLHKLGIRMRLHILPVHYYSPVANIIELEKTKEIWAKKSNLPGININLEEQINNLSRITSRYKNEYLGNRNYKYAVLNHFGPGYGYIEAQALHAVVRFFKPKKIIEVGSGVSTFCILKAIELNQKETNQNVVLTCIEPFPSNILKKLGELGKINLINKIVQVVPFSLFEDLNKGDLLFIDSSHVVKPGSDVNHLILEILPRLKRGVIVHFHDIYFPYDYSRDTLQTFFPHGGENSLLRAFLIFNSRSKIIFSLSQLHYDKSEFLKDIFPEYESEPDISGLRIKNSKNPFDASGKHFPSSIYIRV